MTTVRTSPDARDNAPRKVHEEAKRTGIDVPDAETVFERIADAMQNTRRHVGHRSRQEKSGAGKPIGPMTASTSPSSASRPAVVDRSAADSTRVQRRNALVRDRDGFGISLPSIADGLRATPYWTTVPAFLRYLRQAEFEQPPVQDIARQYQKLREASATGVPLNRNCDPLTQQQVMMLADEVLEQRQPGLVREVLDALAHLPAPKPAVVKHEVIETAHAEPIILTGHREGADPWRDGALLDVRTVQTRFGTLAMTTGPGLPKQPRADMQDANELAQYTLNRDAIGMCELTVDGKRVLRGCVADGMGFLEDSDKAAAFAVRHMTTAPDFYEAAASLNDGIAGANFAPEAATCMSAFEIRKEGGKYRIKLAHGGDTNVILIRGGEVVEGLPEHTAQRYIDDVEARLDAGEPVEPFERAQAERLKSKYTAEQLPQIVLSSFKASSTKPYFLTADEDEWEAESGDVLVFVTDGIVDNRNVDEIAWDVTKIDNNHPNRTPADRCREMTEVAFMQMRRGTGHSKEDNIAGGVLVLE